MTVGGCGWMGSGALGCAGAVGLATSAIVAGRALARGDDSLDRLAEALRPGESVAASAVDSWFHGDARSDVSLQPADIFAESTYSLDDSVDRPAPPEPFGTVGSWRWAIYGGGALDIRRDGEQYNTTWAASHFLADGFSIDFELGGYFFNQPDTDSHDSLGANFNMLLRWHFYRQENWSVYADGGAGVIAILDEIPEGGTHFNFTPQAGVGVSLAVGDNGARLMTGIRWHHLSNARLEGADHNLGRDSLMVYAGLSFPW